MTMKRINQIFGCFLLAVFVFFAVLARTSLKYWMAGAVSGPGPGFFPFWISIILAGITLYWLLQITIKPSEVMPKDFLPSRSGGVKIVIIFGNLILFTVIVKPLGFFLALFIFLLIILFALGHRDLRRRIFYVLFAIAGSWLFTYVFGELLEVDFPKSSIGILRAIGL